MIENEKTENEFNFKSERSRKMNIEKNSTEKFRQFGECKICDDIATGIH